MQMIDTHVHVWTNDPEYPWASKPANTLQYDAHPEALLKVMEEQCIEWAVLVQYVGYGWDNRYVLHVQKRFPAKFIAVCRVNPADHAAPDHLSFWTEVHGFRGVRISPDPLQTGDWFAKPLMVPLFKRANELDVPVLILTKPPRLTDLATILEQVPETGIVLDHMADCLYGTNAEIEQLLDLARYPRVYLKLGHISTETAHLYPPPDTYSFLKRVYETYGASRIMWGSDWPFCLGKSTYAQALTHFRDEMSFLTAEDLDWIYEKTALKFWRFPAAASDHPEGVPKLEP